jgi:3-hydroxyisobutyrate dehydrogenase-like beta-hydroxyacid dehydrogenase
MSEQERPGEQPISVGFIGLGRMGEPMAVRIMQEGFPLTVWARRAESMAALVGQGAAAAASVADLGARCDYVGLCVLDDAAVAAITDDLIPAMRPGSLLAIHSTILPESCEVLERRCAERGVLFVDAPVDGGGDDAAAGRLTVMASGSDEALARAAPVLNSFGARVIHLGPAGAGQRAKVICNSLLAAKLGLTHAAMNLADAFGLERDKLHEVIRHGAGNSVGFELYPQLSSPRQAHLLYKDVGLMEASGGTNKNAAVIGQAAHYWLDSDK